MLIRAAANVAMPRRRCARAQTRAAAAAVTARLPRDAASRALLSFTRRTDAMTRFATCTPAAPPLFSRYHSAICCHRRRCRVADERVAERDVVVPQRSRRQPRFRRSPPRRAPRRRVVAHTLQRPSSQPVRVWRQMKIRDYGRLPSLPSPLTPDARRHVVYYAAVRRAAC